MIQTPRLLLLPLTRDVMLQTIGAGEFVLGEIYFPQGWAGEAEIVFPIHLMNTAEDEAVRGSYVVVERVTGHAAGLLGTKHTPVGGGVEIGYGLRPENWGQGYATEAVTALLDELRGWPDVSMVLAETRPDNLGSIRVLEKNGFLLTGRRHDPSDGEVLTWARDITAA